MVYQILFEVEQGKKSAKEAQAALNKVKKEADGIEGSVKKLRKAFLQAFAVEELTRKVVQFTTEAINLARQAEGVQKAFSNLNDPNILNQLRAATRGTVSDLELMKAAVRAQNFKIPLEQLGTYFNFARQRARDTGQSVTDLTNKIVDGIGRKSTLILDDLGLSLTEIQTEVNKTGDFTEAVGNIIQREMGKAGDATLSAADKIDIYNTSIENLKLKLGQELVPILGTVAGALNQIFFPSTLEVVKAYSQLREENEKVFEQVSKGFRRLGAGIEDAANLDKLRQAVDLAKSTGFGLQSLVSLREEGGKTVVAFTELGERITAQREAMERINKPTEKFGETVAGLQEKIKQLKEEQLGVNIATADGVQKYRDLDKDIGKIEQRIKDLTETLSESGKKMPEFVVDFEDPLDQLNRLFDASAERAKKLREEMEALSKLKFEVPSEESPEEEIAQLQEINKQLEIQKFVRTELNGVIAEQATAIGNLLQAVGAGAEAQLAFSIVSTLASQGEAIGKGIASASALPYPANLGAIASVVATIIGTFTQVFSLINQANAAKAQAQSAQAKVANLAEGEIDIHRPGEVIGKDSIPSLLMPGESVIKTTSTSRYKPFLQAIQDGNLEDLIRVNYVEPALAMTAMERAEKDSSIDYSQQWYRQYRTTLDGISISKQSISELRQINKKLSRKNGGWYV